MIQVHCTVDVEIRLITGDELCWQVVVYSPGQDIFAEIVSHGQSIASAPGSILV